MRFIFQSKSHSPRFDTEISRDATFIYPVFDTFARDCKRFVLADGREVQVGHHRAAPARGVGGRRLETTVSKSQKNRRSVGRTERNKHPERTSEGKAKG